MWFWTGKYRFSENLTVDSYENLRLWSVFHQKFFGDIYFDTWHLQWCQITLFCIFITTEYIWMVKYLSGLFLERNFLAIFILKSDTSSGVKLHCFVFWSLLNISGWHIQHSGAAGTLHTDGLIGGFEDGRSLVNFLSEQSGYNSRLNSKVDGAGFKLIERAVKLHYRDENWQGLFKIFSIYSRVSLVKRS